MSEAIVAEPECELPCCTNRGVPSVGGRCIRCEAYFDDGDTEMCPAAPDRGPHESLSVRQGHSLHPAPCPRCDPHDPDPGACTCRVVNIDRSKMIADWNAAARKDLTS